MKKFFSNDKIMLVALIIALIGGIVDVVVYGLQNVGTTVYINALRMICGVVLLISYKKHAKNVMKGMMGALLMANLIMSLCYLNFMDYLIDKICIPVYIVLSIGIFLTHFLINGDHHSRNGLVLINTIFVILLFVNSLVWNIWWLQYCTSIWEIAAGILTAVSSPCLSYLIIWVETKLNDFRIERENKGWTEN